MNSSRASTEGDLETVTDMLAAAFADDPLWGYWAFPDRERAVEQRREWFRFYVGGALRFPWVRLANGDQAAAVWIPPGEAALSDKDTAREESFLTELLGEHADVQLEAVKLFEDSHPHEPHYYLSLLGIDLAQRGKGVGMALVEENLARIDAEAMPAYLESTNPANLKRYERVGFTKIGEFTFSGGGPTVDTMWREARAGEMAVASMPG